MILTNAHVVAGERRTAGPPHPDGPGASSATVVAFDSNRDLALLQVPGIAEPVLPLYHGIGRRPPRR